MNKPFDDVCRIITEDDWQRARKRERRNQIIAAVVIGIPCFVVVALTLVAAHMWLIP